jgi:hypothetical protein
VTRVPRRARGVAELPNPASSDDGRCYREIRSARFPLGLPDRTDLTVIEAFDDAWLLIEHSPSGAALVGVAEDYDDARAWLAEQPHGPE